MDLFTMSLYWCVCLHIEEVFLMVTGGLCLMVVGDCFWLLFYLSSVCSSSLLLM